MGVQGPAGPQGLRGHQGVSGSAGDIGPQGFAGLTGDPGANGQLSVYQGPYDPSKKYYYNAIRRDIVSYSGHYYIAGNPAKDGNSTWGLPTGTDWTSFGAEFSSVATALLLAENALVTKALVIGESDTDTGLIMSANYVARVSGWYIDATGYAEFNQILFRGGISTASAVFNADQPDNTMPSTSVQIGDPGDINVDNFAANGYLVPMLTFSGWLIGGAGYSNNRFGRSDPRFQLNSDSGFSSIGTGHYASVELMYSRTTKSAQLIAAGQRILIETVGTTDWVALGAPSNTAGVFFMATAYGNSLSGTGTCSEWLQINVIEASIHDPGTFVGLSDALFLTGLTGTDTVRFGMNFKSDVTTSKIVRAKLAVTCFNF
jgi:hypothetical protein